MNVQTMENHTPRAHVFLASEKRPGYPASTVFSADSLSVLGKPAVTPQALSGKLENYFGPRPAGKRNEGLTTTDRMRIDMADGILVQEVYFIQSGTDGPIKIGIAENPAGRLRQMQTGSPEKLTLLGTLHGGIVREARLHRMLAEWRYRGEWFYPSAEVLAHVPGLDTARLRKALGDVSHDEAIRYKLKAVMSEIATLTPTETANG